MGHVGCELCESLDWEEGETHRFVECRTSKVPMLVLREHRQFTEFEKFLVEVLFSMCRRTDLKDRTLRWEQRRIKDHGHLHFE